MNSNTSQNICDVLGLLNQPCFSSTYRVTQPLILSFKTHN
ncbi:hypothetical protein GPSY_0033 [Paraglaciecola psychrophila 170]|nr:hypothetical protein GPSY_0033 [Paraglaciecola psychrophila 170]